jgi:4-hydroxybenzoate polyprenyltransferase
MKIIDYGFLLRPMLIVPVWTISLLGARAAEWRVRSANPFTIDRYPFLPFTNDDLHLLLLLLLATMMAGGIFILNQIYDIESDRRNKKLFLIADGHVAPTEAWGLYFFATFASIVGAFLFNWQLGILFVVGALLGLQYSLPVFNVRENPYKAFRNNILGHGMLAFLFGWVMTQSFNIEGIVKSIPYALAVGAVYLNTTLPDIEGDKAFGKRTYGAEWGVFKSLRTSLTLVVLSIIFAIMSADWAFVIASAVSLPFFAAARFKQSIKLATLASKTAILLLSLLAAFYYPPYLVLLLLTILASRIYYSSKFSLDYPSLTEKN